MVFSLEAVEVRRQGIAGGRFWKSVGRTFQTLHPAHAALETGGSCRFTGSFSAHGSVAETKSSQRLVEAIASALYHHRRTFSKANRGQIEGDRQFACLVSSGNKYYRAVMLP
jgi:hypothetical protein